MSERNAMTDAAVEIIRTADRHRGIATITLAFVTDPVVRWAWPSVKLRWIVSDVADPWYASTRWVGSDGSGTMSS